MSTGGVDKITSIDQALDVLELPNGALFDDVKRAHRELIQIWHPDKYCHNAKLQKRAEAKTKQINIALELLNSAKTSTPYYRSSPQPDNKTRANWGSTQDSTQRPPKPTEADPAPAAPVTRSPKSRNASSLFYALIPAIIAGYVSLTNRTNHHSAPQPSSSAQIASVVRPKLQDLVVPAKLQNKVPERSETKCRDLRSNAQQASPATKEILNILLTEPLLECADNDLLPNLPYFSIKCENATGLQLFGCGGGVFSISETADEDRAFAQQNIAGKKYNLLHLMAEGSSGIGYTLVFAISHTGTKLLGGIEGRWPEFQSNGFSDSAKFYHGWEPNCCPSAITTRFFSIRQGRIVLTKTETTPNPDARSVSVGEFYDRLGRQGDANPLELLSANLSSQLPRGFSQTQSSIAQQQPRLTFEQKSEDTVEVQLCDRPCQDQGSRVLQILGNWKVGWNEQNRFWELISYTKAPN